ncbi:ABC transporter substrate-binding protein [Treponema sp. TIM-1]|uniref:ABC transporter substrate-binding protein n=1 Tax=Treponema sp. TIM-1 TaxID=2898417 RepID=UPI00397F53B0
MKSFKHGLFFCFIFGCLAAFLGAQSSLTIYGIKGPSGVGMIRLFENPPAVSGMNIRLEALAQADLLAARFLSGEAKVGILPPNVAAKIASGGKPLQIAAVVGTGMLSLLTSDPAVRGIEDLRGKTVEVAGQGATPDLVFRRILLSRGINPGRDIQLGYALAYPEIAQSLIAGRIATALLPEPFATMARTGKPGLREVADIEAEWIKAGGKGNFPMTVLVVDADFARSRPDVVRTILAEYENSIRWVIAHPGEAGALVEKHDLGLRAAVVSAAIPRSNYVFIPATEARASLEALFKIFLDFSPAAIGNALPPDSFYLKL